MSKSDRRVPVTHFRNAACTSLPRAAAHCPRMAVHILLECGHAMMEQVMARNSLIRQIYNVYAWSVGSSFVLVCGIFIIAMPRLQWRRRLARRTARGLFRLLGMKLTVHGLDRLPEGGCIVVANHASYLDGIVLTAALPPRFGFVIKREMSRVPLVGLLLHRLGSQFVDRFDPHASRSDAGKLVRQAVNGSALGIFPEGTFVRTPGIRHFHMGAFRAACRGGLPLVISAIRGTRTALPAESWAITPYTVEVTISDPLYPRNRNRDEALRLMQQSRTEISRLTGEPLI